MGYNARIPGLQATDPGLHARAPGLQATDPGLHVRTPGLQATDPGLHVRTPGLQATNPGLHVRTPGLQATNPGLQATNPGLHPLVGFDTAPRAANAGRITQPLAAATPERTILQGNRQEVVMSGWVTYGHFGDLDHDRPGCASNSQEQYQPNVLSVKGTGRKRFRSSMTLPWSASTATCNCGPGMLGRRRSQPRQTPARAQQVGICFEADSP